MWVWVSIDANDIGIFMIIAFSLAKAATKGNAQDFSAPASKIVLVSTMLATSHHKSYLLSMDLVM